MVIDFHTHVFPDDVAAAAMPTMEENASVEGIYDGTIAGLLATMDRSGVDVSVLQPVATRPAQVQAINDWIASRSSARLVPFGAMHPDFESPAQECARMVRLGIRGIKIHPEFQACRPDDPRMCAIYEAAEEHRLFILFHAGIDIAIDTLHGEPETFGDIASSYPGLRIVLAHMGGFGMWDRVRSSVIGRDVWLDTSYSLDHLPHEEFIDMVRSHGVERVLFGSDGPWGDPSADLSTLRELPFSAEELDSILHGNAEDLLATRD